METTKDFPSSAEIHRNGWRTGVDSSNGTKHSFSGNIESITADRVWGLKHSRTVMASTNASASTEPVPTLWQILQLAVTQGPNQAPPFQSYATTTHKFLFGQGIMYVVVGCLGAFLPSALATVMLIFDPAATDLLWMRLLGVALTVIGYFYIQGSRHPDIKPLVISTCFGRLTFVPALLLFEIACGCSPQLCLAFGLLDPTLAVLTHRVWSQQVTQKEHAK